MPHLENIAVVHFSFVNNDSQHYSRVLHTFAPKKLFGQL